MQEGPKPLARRKPRFSGSEKQSRKSVLGRRRLFPVKSLETESLRLSNPLGFELWLKEYDPAEANSASTASKGSRRVPPVGRDPVAGGLKIRPTKRVEAEELVPRPIVEPPA